MIKKLIIAYLIKGGAELILEILEEILKKNGITKTEESFLKIIDLVRLHIHIYKQKNPTDETN